MIPTWLEYPWWLLLLLVMPALGVLRALAHRRRYRALLQMGVVPAREPWFTLRSGLRFLRGLIRSTMVTLLVLGIAGPQWGREWGLSGSKGRDVVVVLDLSRSMFASDVQPNRVGRAREAVRDLVNNSIDATGGYRVGLVVFAARSKVLCPLTHDIGHFREVLDRIGLEQPPADLLPQSEAESGTRIGQALFDAIRLHDPEFRGSQDILLFSDGDDPGTDSVTERFPAVTAAREQRIPIHTVGIGDPEHAADVPFEYSRRSETRLNEESLKDIARSTFGVYVPIHPGKTASMGRLFEDQMSTNLRENTDDAISVYRQHYDWFFASALALLAVDLLLGVRWRNVFRFVSRSPEARG
jgi:Ca-activated chloride channel family protein